VGCCLLSPAPYRPIWLTRRCWAKGTGRNPLSVAPTGKLSASVHRPLTGSPGFKVSLRLAFSPYTLPRTAPSRLPAIASCVPLPYFSRIGSLQLLGWLQRPQLLWKEAAEAASPAGNSPQGGPKIRPSRIQYGATLTVAAKELALCQDPRSCEQAQDEQCCYALEGTLNSRRRDCSSAAAMF
jgi:hypothetical protein